MSDALERGRDSFARQAWGESYAQLYAAERDGALAPGDLLLLAMSARLIGNDKVAFDVLTRAHQEYVRVGDAPGAARAAFWLAFGLINTGEMAQAQGWLGRAHRILDEDGSDCAERGYLLLPQGIQALYSGDPAAAYPIFSEALAIGERFRESDLIALGRLGRGQSLLRLGQTAEGLALLDEVLVSVTAGEVSAVVVGVVYCSAIEVCKAIFDLRRAQEWTAVLTQWCDSQPDLVPYRGQCLVRRSEIMQFHGAWQDAIAEAQRAFERLSEPRDGALGSARYQQAELHRLRGEFAEAEAAYRQASEWGNSPEPGLALLRLAQGNPAAAEAIIRRALDEANDHVTRSGLLPAYAEIMLAAGDLEAARKAAGDLAEIARGYEAPVLRALAAHAMGAVLLAEGDARGGLASLRGASTAWHALDAPHEAARTRVLVGLACRALGDEDGAAFEFEAARRTFQQLGALPHLAALDALTVEAVAMPATSVLSPRELEVLRLVATGKTNRVIAVELFISERTVARHVSNIFTKLGLSSRAAATAYAYEHQLVSAIPAHYTDLPTPSAPKIGHIVRCRAQSRCLPCDATRFREGGSTMETMRATERIETVVIGGGQAGLAVGYHLKRRGLPFVILDANERTGDAWRRRWDSLRLFSPARYDGLPGMRFPAHPRYFPTKDEMADFLENYARHFELPVRHGMRVDRLSKENGGFVVEAGAQRFEADNVVVAMSNYQRPVVPAFAQDLDPRIVQLHSRDYRNPAQLREGGVLLVGAGNSGAEIAIEVSKSHETWMSGPDTGHIPFRIEGVAGRFVFVRLVLGGLFQRIATVRSPIGRKLRGKLLSGGGPLIRVKPKDIEAAGVRRIGRTAGVQDGRPALEDGQLLDVTNVIWCSGFDAGFAWIDLPVFEEGESGHGHIYQPRHYRGIVESEPGLYFVGLPFLYAASSATIQGVGRDADHVVKAIARRAVMPASAPTAHPIAAG